MIFIAYEEKKNLHSYNKYYSNDKKKQHIFRVWPFGFKDARNITILVLWVADIATIRI